MQAAVTTREEVLDAIKAQRYQFNFERDVPEALKADREIVLAALEHAQCAFADLPVALHSDREVMFAFAVRGWGGSLDQLPDTWRDDTEFATAAIRADAGNYEHASDRVRGLREIALMAVAEKSRFNIQYVPSPMNRDREVLTTALRGHKQAYMYVPEDLRDDPEFLHLALEHSDGNSLVFEAMPDWARDDREIALKMVSREGFGFRYASERLRDDKDVLLAALAKDVRVLGEASARLRADPDVVRFVAGHKDCRSGFQYLDPVARNAPDIVAVAIEHGADLEDLSEQWRDDEAVVRAAVGRWGKNYGAASARLKAVREIALLAAQDHLRGHTWGFDFSAVPSELRADPEIARHAVRTQAENAKHLPEALLNDHAFLRELVSASDRVLEYLPPEAGRSVALARIQTGVHHGRRIVVEAVPATGHVYEDRRAVEHVTVEDPSGHTVRVDAMPVLTYEDDGPVGSYLSVRYLINLVLCGGFLFLVQENSGDETFTYGCALDRMSKDEAIRLHLWHHVYLVPWTGTESLTGSIDSLRERSVLLYEGRTKLLPSGLCAFPGENAYQEAMSILGGSTPRNATYASTGARELTLVKAPEAQEVGGAARVYVQAEGDSPAGWRWLLPNVDGPRASLAVLRRTTDADDWRWLAGKLGAATPAQREVVVQHFAGGPLEADVRAACAQA
jgi:hypothetical protein